MTYDNTDHCVPEILSKVGNLTQIAGLKHYILADGRAKGVEGVDIRTGSGLEFTVLPGRGMDLAWASYRSVPLSYMSKTGIVSPSYYESGGMNWLRSFFGGLLTTCGLCNVGGPEQDMHPVIGTRDLGLHGRISNCAADQVSTFEDWENGAYVMRVSGRLQEACLHAEALSLRREITTGLFQKEFTIRDTVCNHSDSAQPVMLLYHINIGYPLLDAGSRILCASRSVRPADGFAAEAPEVCALCHGPAAGIAERCYIRDLATDADGNAAVALVNDALELGLAITFPKAALPYFNQWSMLSSQEYVVGLEPGNCLPSGLRSAREEGRLDVLAPGERKTYTLHFCVLDGAADIRRFEETLLTHT